MPRQLTLDLAGDPAHSRADFLVADANALAVAALDAPDAWPQGRMLLIGEAGAGKTHLASFWAAERGAMRVSAPALTPEAADGLACQNGALVIEDAHCAGGLPQAEQALFHLWNICHMRNCLLLLTARRAPRDWGVVLPDLRSRMDAMPQTRIAAPDEGLLAAVLVKLFADRQLSVPAGLIDWLVLRMDRDLGLARKLVAALDESAMADQKPVTRRLASDLLDQLTAPDP
ncbi:DnaA ATPase domain-containing protein [Paracoccus tegillarcae]|uniref:Chromosomal replication initiator DnaA n=1 Tax=Paracoccus tegillarcae TaxID=1529068 RepID=A0A2K9EHC9_9RHOB|nr:DnaA/Hda family protein [Paracoccus tegillarcae]AUH34373.1 chromosomal replication initiator DnaA [Paracoccus tegillarcae]